MSRRKNKKIVVVTGVEKLRQSLYGAPFEDCPHCGEHAAVETCPHCGFPKDADFVKSKGNENEG